MRALALGLTLALTALPAAAQSISDEIGTTGLTATEARLAALTAPTDEERFALGGVRFLARSSRRCTGAGPWAPFPACRASPSSACRSPRTPTRRPSSPE